MEKAYKQDAPQSHQLRALFRKNASFQMRQKCTVCCQISVPVILVLLMGAMQILVHNLMDAFPVSTNPNLPFPMATAHLAGAPAMFWEVDNTNGAVGVLSSSGENSGLLSLVRQARPVSSSKLSPYMVLYPSQDAMMKNMSALKHSYLTDAIYNGSITEPSKLFEAEYPAGAFKFDLYSRSNTTSTLTYTAYTEGQIPFPYSTPRFSSGVGTALGMAWEMMSLVANALMASITGGTVSILPTVASLAYFESRPFIDVGSLMGSMFFPFALSFLMPLYIHAIVLEKQERLREMMKMMGLEMRNYWLITYLYYLIMYGMVVLVVVGASLAFQFAIFTKGSAVGLFFLLFGWGNVQISLSFLLGAIFNKTRTATIVAYLLVLVGVILNIVLSVAVWADSEPPAVYYFYAPFAFYQAIGKTSQMCGVGLCPSTADYRSGLLGQCMLAIYIEIFVYLILAFYLDAVLPREFGLRRHPLFFVTDTVAWFKKRFTKARYGAPASDGENVSLIVKDVPTGDFVTKFTHEDSDVAEERQRVCTNAIPRECPLVIRELRKVYDDGKVAVDSLCLAVDNGECFGLLGPNGAGKTTSISVLTGLYPPTSGDARVAGYDIRTEMDYAHRRMGVCPQFDTLWMDLTCEETLLFYTRLKGIASAQEKEHVDSYLNMVGLLPFKTMRVVELSGGMRRRLSIAISLVGDPRIIFLDEPTTGLDPETRRHVWDVILRVRTGRCIVLTTHSMEEADVLCTRIGIMSQGTLRCLGPQQHLKAKFGQGYSLKVNSDPTYDNDVIEFVQNMFPFARISERFPGYVTFQVPRAGLVVSDLFEKMEAARQRVHIDDWGISQTSLEDVFLTIVSRDTEP
eukprot:TRINITY_DN2727_c0_g1_i3.p1 TRINITY_DN2727_c0_g1~~TRINITY_DN2727_c0_g1_i3.p1  ORF type:complete len:854 (+),score=218.34 TRINITY_DN2727_c0_g1_i3:132-2693(+)